MLKYMMEVENMICKSCGQEFGNGETCTFCGAVQERGMPVALPDGMTAPVRKTAVFPILTMIICLAGIIIGIVFLAGGFSSGFYWSGEVGRDTAFGGDFYTEIHERSVELTYNTSRIVKNTYSIGELLERGIGIGFIFTSLMRAAAAVEGWLKDKKL